jgi:osmoprotectant transport system permease protein
MPPGTKVFDVGWVASHLDQVALRLVQHLQLIVPTLLLGIIISLVLAVWAVRQPRVYGPITAITGLLYTIPSLAAFALLVPITGITLVTALIPLTTYTLLILFRSFATGFTSVPAEILEAAEGMGYTRRQRLVRVELPLAVPLMIAGVRLASVTSIGLATVAAVIGGDTFGGLGQLITEGIQTFFPTKYLLGAALSVLLAFTADFLFVRFERLITPWSRARVGAP